MKSIGLYPRVQVDTAGSGVVCQAGGVVLVETARRTGLLGALSQVLTLWRKPMAVHDPGKVLTDLVISVALGGDCLADVAVLRAEPGVFGAVASDPTVSRLIDALAADAPAALAAINTARVQARAAAWSAAGRHAPNRCRTASAPLIIDVDATLITAHSEKEKAAPTFKKGFGHHPLWAFADHGADGGGEPLSFLLRPGNAGSNTASDHITVIEHALAQLPRTRRRTPVLIRADSAGGTHDLLTWLTERQLGYSVGFGLQATFASDVLAKVPTQAWSPAYTSDGDVRDGAWVADVTALMNLSTWPDGMRVIIRKERPHPGAQLRITDVDGHRITAFATNTTIGQIADLELRHRRRARCEDRIRVAKDTGLRNLPLHDFDQNQIWCAIVALACELTTWTQLLAFTTHPARRWEPKRLRLRLFSIAGRLSSHGRQRHLHLATTAPWAHLVTEGLQRLQRIPAPG